jgi:hypothetical protein
MTMSDAIIPAQGAGHPEDSHTAELALKRVATVALLALTLGFVMQGVILAAKLAGGVPFPGLRLLVDLAQGVTWSFLVCAGVAIGAALAKGRAALAGLIAGLFTPLALAAAKSSQKVMGALINASDAPALLSLATLSVIKAIEYGILGWVLAVLVQKSEARPAPYVAAGAAVGLVFGGSIVVLNRQVALAAGTQLDGSALAVSIINEVLFPIGCSMVIFAGVWVGRNLRIALNK